MSLPGFRSPGFSVRSWSRYTIDTNEIPTPGERERVQHRERESEGERETECKDRLALMRYACRSWERLTASPRSSPEVPKSSGSVRHARCGWGYPTTQLFLPTDWLPRQGGRRLLRHREAGFKLAPRPQLQLWHPRRRSFYLSLGTGFALLSSQGLPRSKPNYTDFVSNAPVSCIVLPWRLHFFLLFLFFFFGDRKVSKYAFME